MFSYFEYLLCTDSTDCVLYALVHFSQAPIKFTLTFQEETTYSGKPNTDI